MQLSCYNNNVVPGNRRYAPVVQHKISDVLKILNILTMINLWTHPKCSYLIKLILLMKLYRAWEIKSFDDRFTQVNKYTYIGFCYIVFGYYLINNWYIFIQEVKGEIYTFLCNANSTQKLGILEDVIEELPLVLAISPVNRHGHDICSRQWQVKRKISKLQDCIEVGFLQY